MPLYAFTLGICLVKSTKNIVLEKQKFQIWVRNIIKSYIWLILPLTLLGSVFSCSAYIEAGSHLTAASVSVRGYYRNDGTYVHPYNRRPPGGAIHDRPYESTRTLMGFLFILSVAGSGIVIFIYVTMSKDEISEILRAYEKEQERIRLEKRREQVSKILKRMQFDFSILNKVPVGLQLGGTTKSCKFCNTYLQYKDFYIAFKSIKLTHYVCVECLKKRDSIGRGQPRSKYLSALSYINKFEKYFEKFYNSFYNENDSSCIEFHKSEIKQIFINNIRTKHY